MSTTNTYEVMHVNKNGPKDYARENKKIDPEFANKSYIVCERESQELLECVLKHPNDVDQCAKEYHEVQHCERKHY